MWSLISPQSRPEGEFYETHYRRESAMRWRLSPSVVVAAALLGSTVAHSEGFTLSAPPRIAFLLYADINDGGWTQAFNEARVRIETALNTRIPYVENIPEVAGKIKPAAEGFIGRGYNIILGTGFGYSTSFKELSEAYPKIAFLNASGTTNGPNLESYYGRTYESQYLCGMVAGAMTKTGKLGFVAAHPIGPVNWTINGFELGAKLMNPNVTTTVIFTGEWNDPVKERAAASALADQGIDVIGQHVDTPTPQIVAQERGIYGTGHHRDLRDFAPKATLCSSAWTWDKFLTPELKKVAAGNWQPSPYGAFPGIKDGGTDIACCNTVVPKEAVAKIMAERDAIIAGKQIFTGPMKNTAGKEMLAAGQPITDAALWKMDWYIPGVITQK
jgi:basic membrane lipoprotein Med (substrate-binding protein (PBP1-ABC) superfamily)